MIPGYPERLVVKLGDVIVLKHMVIYGINFTGRSWIFGRNKRMLIFVFVATLHAAAAWREMVDGVINRVLFYSVDYPGEACKVIT